MLQQSLLRLIRRTSAELPDDVADAILRAVRNEPRNTTGPYAMEVVKRNCEMARAKSQPICQETGSILFFVHGPKTLDQAALRKTSDAAVVEATQVGYLR